MFSLDMCSRLLSITGCCRSQYPLDGSSVPGTADQPKDCSKIPTMLKTENQIIFRHKIFYLKHLVLTDTHNPTDNLLGHTIHLEQEAIALHCITFTVHRSSRSKTTKSIQKFTKIQMRACKISEPHPPCNSHTDLLETFLQTLSKSNLFQEYISMSFHTKLSLCYCSSKQIL